MKTFEEKWTAWLDGQLSGRELAEFEASLPDKAAAEAEKADAKKLGELLKRELGARTLTNEEFFSHQLRERIAQQQARRLGAAGAREKTRHGGQFLVCCGRAPRRSLSFWFVRFSSCTRKIRLRNHSILPKF